MFVTLTRQDNGEEIRLQVGRIEGIEQDPFGSNLVMASGNSLKVKELPQDVEEMCMDAMVEWSVEIGAKAAEAGARATRRELEG